MAWRGGRRRLRLVGGGRRGRLRTKGDRLPTPPGLAAAATDWVDADIDERGTTVARRLWHRDVLWYRACPRRLVRLVVVRDPAGVQPDDFFLTSAPAADPTTVATGMQAAGRSRSPIATPNRPSAVRTISRTLRIA